jgi:hypothetical protein
MSGKSIMAALTTPDLNPTDRLVYAYLVGKANGARMCWRSIPEIRSDLGIKSRATICASTGRLSKKGLIRVQRRMRGANYYHIQDPDGRLYGTAANGTGWHAPWHDPEPDVQDSAHQTAEMAPEPAEMAPIPDVQDSAHQAPDVQHSIHQNPIPDVQDSAHRDVQQTGHQESSKKDSKEVNPVLRTGPAAMPPADPPPVPDVRTVLWREGREILRTLTGQPYSAAGGQIGRFLKEAGQDCTIVLDALRAANREQPAEPVPWIVRGIQTRRRGELKFRDAGVAMAHERGLLAPDSRAAFRAGLTPDFSGFNREAVDAAD